jgi:hypothetical protein
LSHWQWSLPESLHSAAAAVSEFTGTILYHHHDIKEREGGEEEEVEEEGEPSFPIPAFNNFNHVGGSIEEIPYSI